MSLRYRRPLKITRLKRSSDVSFTEVKRKHRHAVTQELKTGGGGTTQFGLLGLMNSVAIVAMYQCHHFETALNVSDRQQFVGGGQTIYVTMSICGGFA